MKTKNAVPLRITVDPKLIQGIDATNKCLKEVIRLLKLNSERLVKVFNRSLKVV